MRGCRVAERLLKIYSLSAEMNLYPPISPGTVSFRNRSVPGEGEANVFHPVPHADRWDPWMVIALFAVLALAAGLTFIL